MSKENPANVAAKSTTPATTSTPASTSEPKTDATTPAKDSTSNPAGIIEEGLSTEEPKEEPAVEEPKADEEVPPAEIEPYELELAEDSPLSDEEFDEVVQEAERLKLSKEDAEKLIKMREYSHVASNKIFEQAAQERTKKMFEEYKKDASLHTVEAKLSMRESIKAFGNTPEFKEMFKDPSMNYNVPLAKFLISVGDKIRSGSNTIPTAKSAGFNADGANEVTSAANKFYKDM